MSESEEMYLITIARYIEEGYEGPVPLSRLADRLSVAPVSVNQMVKKLGEAGLVDYIPYKGVELTEHGRQTARSVLRLRRLWELFLVRHLALPLDEADALACRMEHITSDEVADRLAAFLDHPTISATGKLIPASEIETPLAPPLRLAELDTGEIAEVLHIDAPEATLIFLGSEGLQPGVDLEILAIGNNRKMLVHLDGRQITLAASVAEAILVKRLLAEPTRKRMVSGGAPE